MNRRKLLRGIASAAKAYGIGWEMVREGGNHEIWQCGATRVSIPRHSEINELTAEGIQKRLEGELGEGWWK